MRAIYRPGSGADGVIAATMEYRFNGLSSGRLEFSNLENGMLEGTIGGLYAQFSPDRANPDDFAEARFERIEIAVPGGGVVVTLGAGMLVLGRRRRR